MFKVSPEQIKFFETNGYLVLREFLNEKDLVELNQKVMLDLTERIEPFELEAEVDYPGSPKSISSHGGKTIRRLLLAYERDELFKKWAHNLQKISVLKSLLKSDSIHFVPSHHNCVMTKQPKFSSETHWHKDIRYWNFTSNELITTWLPLGNEKQNNGGLKVIPGSHLWSPEPELLDERLFLREDIEETQSWLNQAVEVELNRGDLLFFHAGLFHAAGKNNTDRSKNALVFTYHGDGVEPIQGTKSSKYKEIKIS